MLPLLALSFSIVLDYAYVLYVYPVFEYSGLVLDEDSIAKVLIKCFVYIVMAYSLSLLEKSDRNFMFFITVLIVIPIGTIYAYGAGDGYFFSLSIVFYFVIYGVVYFHLIFINKMFYIKHLRVSLLACLALFVIYFMLIKFYPVITLLSTYSDSVELRRKVFEVYYNKIDAYMLIWLFTVIIPVAILRSLILDRRLLSGLLIIVSLLSYPLMYRKEFMLITIFVLMSYYSYRYSKSYLLYWFALLFMVLVLFFGDQIYVRYLINRQFISIGVNQYMYYDYIKNWEFVSFSNSFLRFFLDYPYHDTMPKIIGALRYDSVYENRSNSGVIGAAYMQGGLIVVIIYSLLIGYIYNQYKYFDVRSNLNTINFFSIVFIYKLSNNDLITTIFTGGILMFFIIVIACYKQRGLKFK